MAPSGIFYQGDDVASPGLSIGASSMVTDANSAYPNLQRNASFNSDTYSVSGSSIMDVQNINKIPYLQKRPRLDVKQDEIVLQQIMQRQNTQTLVQQQQQFLRSLPPAQRDHILQQHQMRQQIPNQTQNPVSSMKRPHDNGICSRRLMKYLYHLRQHPPENSIAYWRKFVTEYYSPRAKMRWCLSLYNNVANHSLGVFPQANMDAWHCDICGSKSGKGFEATFEVLPRLNSIKFASGVKDELLFLDLPRESTFPSGIMMLEYGKAVEESVYEQLRVVREGHLRIIFSSDLKILSWEFCSRSHEEFISRRLVTPQVNHLMQVAQKCQSIISESGGEEISQQDLQTNSNMVVTAGRQLAKTLELQSVNDLGFSKTYVRCLQIAEVVGSMKNLMDVCLDQKVGPIESLKTFTQAANSSKFQMPKANGVGVAHLANIVNGQLNNAQNMPMRQNSMNSNNSNHNSSSTFQKTTGNTTINTQSSSYNSGFSKEIQKLSLLGPSGRGNVANNTDTCPAPSRVNGIEVGSNCEIFPSDCVNGDDRKAPNKAHDDPLSDDMVKNIADAFIDNGFFSFDFNDSIDFDWKM